MGTLSIAKYTTMKKQKVEKKKATKKVAKKKEINIPFRHPMYGDSTIVHFDNSHYTFLNGSEQKTFPIDNYISSIIEQNKTLIPKDLTEDIHKQQIETEKNQHKHPIIKQ